MSNAPFGRLDHVQLAMPCGEEDRAREFYVGVLGLNEVAKPPELAKRGGCWFSSGDVHVILALTPTSVQRRRPIRHSDAPTMMD
jgi:catechol 2,3-dioxygenase-like lactoylglutathione lyase family enzyme